MISNIKWVHNSEAQKLAIDLGLKPILWGEENPTSVAVNQYSADGMTFIKRWGCMNDVERQLKIPHSNISKVCRGKRNTAGGYFWEYEIEKLYGSRVRSRLREMCNLIAFPKKTLGKRR